MYTCREGRGEGALTEECAGSRSNKIKGMYVVWIGVLAVIEQ
jgi:hypothetical protein